MKNSDFESLKRGLAQARAHIAGDPATGVVVHHLIDVRELRERLGLTRKEFAEAYGFDPRTVEQWEQGRRHPDRSTMTYLRIISEHADEIARFVSALPDEDHQPEAERQELVSA